MRLSSYAYGGGVLVLVAIVVGAVLSGSRVRPMGMAVSVHSYQRDGEELSASLLVTNTGTVSLAVPQRFECWVDGVSGCTKYDVGTRHTLFLQPRDYVILSNALWRVRLPADTRAWRASIRFRQMSGRERLVAALYQSGLMSPRTVSRLLDAPKKEADYQWLECGSGLLEVPRHFAEGSTVAEAE